MERSVVTRALLERWMTRLRGAGSPPVPATASPAPISTAEAPPPDSLTLDLATVLAADFPAEYPVAVRTTDAVLARLGSADLAPLARHSPSLAGYDWANYLRCSLCRVVRVQRALITHVAPGGLVLDYGSYFGNFGLACQAAGYRVDAVDAYREYGDALAPWLRLQHESGVVARDFVETGYDLTGLGGTRYDAIVCAGVIEHLPHTPRLLLESLTAALKPGGVLILDTPNLAYLYKRLALLEGHSIFAPISQQYFTELPFEGHHREYTSAEVEWLLRAVGHDIVSIETFNYSVFGQSRLEGEHLAYYRKMEADPSLREFILSVSRRPGA
jgi:2-polyprenyl-3-methyl-5-hydroxy-6-metoxy-1,4-benzoquinol methylase